MEEVIPGVLHWQAYNPNIRADVSCYLLTDTGTALDPLLPEGEGPEWLGHEVQRVRPRDLFPLARAALSSLFPDHRLLHAIRAVHPIPDGTATHTRPQLSVLHRIIPGAIRQASNNGAVLALES